MNSFKIRAMLAAAGISALLLFTADAPASTIGSISDFNLIAFGDLSGGSEVEGRTAVFGDVTGGSKTFAIGGGPSLPFNPPASTPGLADNDALIVGGVVTAGDSLNVNNGGNTRVGGAINRGINNNGGGSSTANDSGVAGILTSLESAVLATESFLSGLSVNSTIQESSNPNLLEFDASPADGIAVFEATSDFIFNRNGGFDIIGDTSADLFVIRATGSEDIVTSGLNINNNEFGDADFQSRIVFFFPDATQDTTLLFDTTDLQFQGGLGGTLFAREADLLVEGAPLEGTVIANNVTLNAQIHLPSTTLSVPEPATAATVALLGGVLLARRQG